MRILAHLADDPGMRAAFASDVDFFTQMARTIFADSGAASVIGSTAPFTGTYRPEAAFSTLVGQTATGTWTLRVFDDAGGDIGFVNGTTLALCIQ